MKKVWMIVLCVLWMAVAVFGCAANPAAESGTPASQAPAAEAPASDAPAQESAPAQDDAAGGAKRVFFTNAFYTAPYCGPLNQSILDTGKELGYEVTIVDGKGDAQVQLDQIETAISENYDAILYFPADAASSVNIVKRLVDSGIPFINNNSRVDDSVAEQAPYVGIDPYAQGVTAGQMVKEVLPDGGNVVIVEGAGGTAVQLGRTNGFMDEIKDTPGIKVLDSKQADWDPATAMTVMEDFISKHGDQIDVVYTEDDGMFEGAYKAASDAGVADQYTFISVSGNQAGIDAIKAGQLYCTVAHSPIDEGVLTMQTLDKMLKGETVELETILESVPVTAENVDDPAFANPGW